MLLGIALGHLGRGRIGIIRYRPIYRVADPHCSFEGDSFLRTKPNSSALFFTTPKGNLEEIRVREDLSSIYK